MLKRFLVFSSLVSASNGGWYDFSDQFDTEEEAIFHAIKETEQLYSTVPMTAHVVDTNDGTIVWPEN